MLIGLTKDMRELTANILELPTVVNIPLLYACFKNKFTSSKFHDKLLQINGIVAKISSAENEFNVGFCFPNRSIECIKIE